MRPKLLSSVTRRVGPVGDHDLGELCGSVFARSGRVAGVQTVAAIRHERT